MKYQHGQPGWDGAKVNHLLGALMSSELHDMETSDETILELYSALRWTYGEYCILRRMVAETIPAIDDTPAE